MRSWVHRLKEPILVSWTGERVAEGKGRDDLCRGEEEDAISSLQNMYQQLLD